MSKLMNIAMILFLHLSANMNDGIIRVVRAYLEPTVCMGAGRLTFDEEG